MPRYSARVWGVSPRAASHEARMRAACVLFGPGTAGFLAASAIGCSSSSSAPTKDGGGQLEASRPPVDARRDTRPKDAEDEAAAGMRPAPTVLPTMPLATRERATASTPRSRPWRSPRRARAA